MRAGRLSNDYGEKGGRTSRYGKGKRAHASTGADHQRARGELRVENPARGRRFVAAAPVPEI